MDLPPLLNSARKGGLARVAALTVMQGVAAGAGAFATRSLFEAIHQGQSLPFIGLAVLVGAGLVFAATRIAARYAGERIGQDYAREIRAALFDQAARMPAQAVAQRRSGYMSLRFVGDMTAFRDWPALGLPGVVAAAVLIPAALFILWLLHPTLALVVGGLVTLSLVAITAGGLSLPATQRRLRARRARIAAEMAERMPMAPHLDRLGRRGTELALLDRLTDRMVSAALRQRLTVESLKAVPDAAAGVAAAAVMILGHQLELQAGTIAASLAVLGLLVTPLRDLGAAWDYWSAFRAAAVKATAALDRRPRDLYRAGRSLPSGPVAVGLSKVQLSSGRLLTRKILPGVVEVIPLAPCDALILHNLLLGLDDPGTGTILLSGIDLRDLSRGTLRRNVALVGPSPQILQGSLRRALTLGCDTRPDDQRLVRLATAQGLQPLLTRLGGLHGRVQEGGRNLTDAERDAISLVRLHLLRPKLVLVAPETGSDAVSSLRRYLTKRKATIIATREI
ncbi:ABC transporter ATP-binding protein [Paracoccus liaowanqingii]|uniref:ABC transporter ATP-binding protein n=1 Tax=Paracoccus liaowanqingii TaxID=2560053 RepID=A0A4Z1BWA2_9RHOB|nr:ABC transporter ATP-binding protein [Paracoccus liaowanqingii]TGN61613.1 ABC transporter ATP-binding protein [Paracoccus liaowanqingii]